MQSLMRKQQLLKEIAERKSELADIQRELESINNMAPEEALAVVLHETTCTSNHTDGCSWGYEVRKGMHDWMGNAHKKYLSKAVKMYKYCHSDGRNISNDDVINILSFIRA